MKPRLRSAPWTEEDRAAWFDWQVNRNRDLQLWGALERISWPADRRDADLMFQAQEVRHFGPAGLQLYGIDFMGWASGWHRE